MLAAVGVAEGVGVGGRLGRVSLEAVDGRQSPAAQESAGSEQLGDRLRGGVEHIGQHRIAQALGARVIAPLPGTSQSASQQPNRSRASESSVMISS
ncbi:hypothetical protein [Streptomyces sp. NPDC057284]|uniref:hypothetical protein n=1 Tax=Streptomyces sp. NPDC057284 TaxID=3346083 RepID=UPI00362E6AB7